MPSPFPGMDPYLENSGLWSDFHQRMISYISEALQRQIRPKYNARVEERVHLLRPPFDYFPDVTIVRAPKQVSAVTIGTAVMDAPVEIRPMASEITESYIKVVHVSSGDVVTTIELLSPINKTGATRRQYQLKQQRLLQSYISLVEIDLLRRGKPTVSITKSELKKLGNPPYVVAVNHAEDGRAFGWPIPLAHRLPRIGIPLRHPDPDAVLDLPAVFAKVYDISGFDDFIDYRQPPPVSLTERETEWLDNLLREKKLRL